jgi:eukaryotic-like serine/threonine-protein kinase
MNIERWRRTEELFHQALELGDAACHAFLDRECGGDADLRRNVDRLLAADKAAAERLDAAVGAAVRSFHGVVAPGSSIGPYEILEPLGEGGMGRIYHARRSDDVFHKDVAIKIVKSGIDSAALLRRFQRERRILATLEHPSIARVLDGGSTDDGLPYLVMEYVDGRNLLDYANEHQLDLHGRLRLFTQVCEAVQYAHDRHIVHRDLKPGNILVDGAGRVRLLDFGISTLVGSEDRAITTTTTMGAGMMTPRYASPEQVRGELVTATSDLYSLGVLLYELLTASPAHRIATDSPAGILKAVCEDEVPMPSEAAQAAQEAGRLVPVAPADLRGDLNRLVLTALAKDPTLRYASARAMAEDIQRYLDSQPVLAPARTGSHRFRTAIRRHPALAASLLAIVAAGLVAGAFILRPARAPRAAVPPGKLMLAVLPLDNLTGTEDRAYFVDGLHEEIISRLGRLQPARLGVIARTSVLQYRGTAKPIDQIGRELGASYILEGSVREAGSTVRVTAQLIQVSDQTHFWTETYDRQMSDLFTVQSEIGAHVADALSVDVLPEALSALEPHRELSLEAYAAYLRARYVWHRRALEYPTNAQRAVDYFQVVTRAAPAYAPGFAGLGQAFHYLSSYSPSREQRRELIEQAKAALSRALELDERSATALAALAWIRFRIDYEWKAAEEGFRKALALEPNSADIHQSFATLLAYGGRHAEAQREIQLALTLDPLSPSLHDSAFYVYLAGQRWDKAQEMAERLGRLVPEDPTSIYYASLVHALRGECGEALADLKKLEAGRDAADPAAAPRGNVANRGNVLGRCGAREDGQRLVKALEANPRSLASTVAQVYASIGERASALQWLEESYRRREEFMIFMAVAPILAPLHDEPRFQALLRQINYPTEWAAAH